MDRKHEFIKKMRSEGLETVRGMGSGLVKLGKRFASIA
jgi:hypothetical protein